MKKGKIKKVMGFVALGICALFFCGVVVRRSGAVGRTFPDNVAEQGEVAQNRSGTIRIAGSTSMARLAGALAEGFMEKYPEIRVTVEFTGSGAGVQEVAAGAIEIGNVSRELTEEERAAGVAENIVALDGIAICVDPGNPVCGLTMEQLSLIYTGEINNWSLAGGEDVPIVVVGREAGSGTRSAFERQAGVEGSCAYTNELDSSGAVMAKVAATPGAIGYISLETAGENVKLLKLDDAEASPENVREGRYRLFRPCIMATRGEIGEQNRMVQVWFAYVYGKEGREITEKLGLAAVEQAAAGQEVGDDEGGTRDS